jgi:hypothetical protein
LQLAAKLSGGAGHFWHFSVALCLRGERLGGVSDYGRENDDEKENENDEAAGGGG